MFVVPADANAVTARAVPFASRGVAHPHPNNRTRGAIITPGITMRPNSHPKTACSRERLGGARYANQMMATLITVREKTIRWNSSGGAWPATNQYKAERNKA